MKKVILAAICFALMSCNEQNEVVAPYQSYITLEVQNMPQIEGAEYELWATFFSFNKPADGDSPTHEGEFKSLGRFSISAAGIVQGVDGGLPRFSLPRDANPQLLRDVVIAVQTNAQSDEPGSIVIGGAFSGDAATAYADLWMSYADAFKSSFSGATGKCTIIAPTSPADSNSGVWFVEIAGATASAGLKNLPTLPPEWRYEGWVANRVVSVNGNGESVQYFSTGKFSRADSADGDGAGAASDTTRPGFNYPGQDFVRGTFRPNLLIGSWSFAVTIEPHPDNSPEPFFLRILSTPPGVAPPTSRVFSLQNVASPSAPTARVTIRR